MKGLSGLAYPQDDPTRDTIGVAAARSWLGIQGDR